MDSVLLARIQFAMTAAFHYIFPVLTIGMGWIIFYFLTCYLKNDKPKDKAVALFWTRIFALTFVVGVATGITMEFQFGTNWARYSKFVGDIFGAPLAAEGVLAFFLESSFLAILVYGAHRVSKKVLWLSSLMVALGATLSAFWIIVANSWQQTPAGYQMVNGRAELTNFFEAVFNPSTVPRFLHSVDGALISGAFFVAGIAAYMILKQKRVEIAKSSLLVSLAFALIFSLLQLPIGHGHAIQVERTQPVKLASFEGLWETRTHAPMSLIGLPNEETEKTDYGIEVPNMLSILLRFDPSYEVKGIKAFPKEDRPPVMLSYFSYHGMVGLWFLFVVVPALGLLLHWKKKLFDNKLVMIGLILMAPLPVIANELGWMAAEIGRQPWIVTNLLRTQEATSISVGANEILFSIIAFNAIYALLFGLWLFLIKWKVDHVEEGV